jgi:tellurite resistance protein TehA-like permease
MGTGGVYILIGGVPFSFRGQHAIGSTIFVINLVIFLINNAGMATLLIKHPESFYNSFFDHEDGLYMPCFGLAIATLFVGVMDYGVPYCGFWLVRTMEVVFFVYIALAVVIALVLEITLRGRYRTLQTITPADNLLFFVCEQTQSYMNIDPPCSHSCCRVLSARRSPYLCLMLRQVISS